MPTSATAPTTPFASTAASCARKVVGEGGNLGFTQRGPDRVRDARRPHQHRRDRQLGRRRLLRPRGQPEDPARPRRRGRRAHVRGAQRGAAELADDVVAHVLYDNYLQVQILSQETAVVAAADGGLRGSDGRARARGLLERALEFLPTSRADGGAARRGQRPGATRAVRAAGLRQAAAARPGAGLVAPRRPLPGRVARRVLPARRGRAVRPPDGGAPAAARDASPPSSRTT